MIKFITNWLGTVCSLSYHCSETEAWSDITTAPLGQDIELAVIGSETRSLPFACVRVGDGWINLQTGQRIDIKPTHWRALPRMVRLSCCG